VETDNSQDSGEQATQQTENAQVSQVDSTEISSLANYRARQQRDSSPSQQHAPTDGHAVPDDGGTKLEDGREAFIPRDRFDEVNTKYQEAQRQLQQLQQQPQVQPQYPQQTPQFGQPNTGMQQGYPQQQQYFQQPLSPTGMQQQPQQSQARIKLDDPSFVKEWRSKIANDPVKGLKEFVEMAIQDAGEPIMQQILQQVEARVAPVHQRFIRDQVQAYSQQRSTDPTFQQIRPAFEQYVQAAAQRGYDVTNPNILTHLEVAVRQQYNVGLPFQQQAPQHTPPAPPFTEQPGAGNQGLAQRQNAPQLTSEQLAMAKTFKMEPAEYAASLKRLGVA
jgi:hypothetical protein